MFSVMRRTRRSVCKLRPKRQQSRRSRDSRRLRSRGGGNASVFVVG